MKDQALYLEVDEDITSAIDKLQKIAGDTVQIVVPKRSTMLQSVINLKLLKKAAADAGKEMVLVTNDRVATDLAARLGLAVAPSLGAKPVLAEEELPPPPASEDVIEADEPEPPQSQLETTAKPDKTPAKKPLFARRDVDDQPAAAEADDGSSTPTPVSTPANKGPRVPNFNQLQRRLMWGGVAAALVVGYFVVMYMYASAKVTLYATGNLIDVNVSFKADPNLSQSDTDSGLLAAQTVTFSKDQSMTFTPTGKKDVGTKASGTMTVSNCTTNAQPLVTGTRFVAPDGKVFRSTADITVPAATYPIGVCIAGQKTVGVTADANGDSYNEAPANYTIPALNNPAVTAHGAQMSGGTTKTLTVVSQEDIDKAKAELLDKDKADVQRDLEGKVPQGYTALEGSGEKKAENVTSEPEVGEEASSATLKLKATYTQLAVSKTDYEKLVQTAEQKQIGETNQIYDDGLDHAKLTAGAREANGRQSFTMTTQASGGARIDKEALAKELKGKKYGDATAIAKRVAGVQRVEISLWPMWSTSLPNRTQNMTIDIQVAEAKGN